MRRYKYHGLFGHTARRRCPHSSLTPLHGDIVNHLGGYRLDCNDCGRLIDGPVRLAKSRLSEAIERFELMKKVR